MQINGGPLNGGALNGGGKGRWLRHAVWAVGRARAGLTRKLPVSRRAASIARARQTRALVKTLATRLRCRCRVIKRSLRTWAASVRAVAVKRVEVQARRQAALRVCTLVMKLILLTLRGAWAKARAWPRHVIDRWIATVKPVRIRAQDEKVTRIVNERERG